MPPPKALAVNVTCSSATEGEYIKVVNLSRVCPVAYGVLDGDKSVTVTLQNAENGDAIQAEIHGRVEGTATTTIASKARTITITASADTASPSVNL